MVWEREYVNAEPIDDEMVVLDLLYHDYFEYRIDRRLHFRPREIPYVRLDCSYSRNYQVTSRVVLALKARCYIKGTPCWGYTDDTNLTISEVGQIAMREFYDRSGMPYGEQWSQRLRAERWMRAASC